MSKNNTVTVVKSDIYSSDWVILKLLNTNDILFLKDALETLVTNFNIQSNTHKKSITGMNCERFDLFQYMNDTLYGIPMLKKVIMIVNEALVASKLTTKKVNTVNMAWTINGYENAFHTIHSHSPRNIFTHCESDGVSVIIYLTVPTLVDSLRTGDLYAVLQDCNKENYTFSHHPNEGDLLIFPNWIYHGTLPQAPGLRQTLNFDFSFE